MVGTLHLSSNGSAEFKSVNAAADVTSTYTSMLPADMRSSAYDTRSMADRGLRAM